MWTSIVRAINSGTAASHTHTHSAPGCFGRNEKLPNLSVGGIQHAATIFDIPVIQHAATIAAITNEPLAQPGHSTVGPDTDVKPKACLQVQ